MSHVLSTGVAGAAEASAFFEAQLKFRTDPADLAADLLAGGAGIVVIDTRSPAHYAEGHIPGAISFPHRTMTASTTAVLDRNRCMSAIATASAATVRPRGPTSWRPSGLRSRS